MPSLQDLHLYSIHVVNSPTSCHSFMVFGRDAWRIRPCAWPIMVEFFIVANKANLFGSIRHLQSRRVYDNNVIRKSSTTKRTLSRRHCALEYHAVIELGMICPFMHGLTWP